MIVLLILLMTSLQALATEPSGAPAPALPDGTVISKVPYEFPKFEESGFLQTPDIREYYENEIKSRFTAAAYSNHIWSLKYLSDGLKIQGFEVLKKDLRPNVQLPILVFNRGGNGDFGKLTVKNLVWLSKLAQKDFLVVTTQYRGSDGGEGKDEFGGADVHDVLNLVKAAKGMQYADPNSVFFVGFSRGVMETYLALKALGRDPSVKATAMLSGECDLAQGLVSRPEMEREVYQKLIPHYATDKKAALDSRSACMWPELIHVPVMILQGTEDKAVDPAQAQLMAQKLSSLHKPYTLEMHSGDHTVWFKDQFSDETANKISAWLRGYLTPSATQSAGAPQSQGQPTGASNAGSARESR